MEKVSAPNIPGNIPRIAPQEGLLPLVDDLVHLAVARLGRGEDTFVAVLLDAAGRIIEMERRRLGRWVDLRLQPDELIAAKNGLPGGV